MKRELLQICLEQQEKVARTAMELMNEAQQMANEYGAPKDRYDSFRTKQMRQADMYAKQYDLAMHNVRTLQRIDPEVVCRKVEFGAVVITNKQNMFISASLGKIELKDTFYYAISVQVPIFKVMSGKVIGDAFVFNGITQKILDID